MIIIIRKYCIIISYHHLLQNSHVKQANIYKSPPRIASPAVRGHFPWGEGPGLMTGIHYPQVLRVKLKGFHMPLRHIVKKKSTATGERLENFGSPITACTDYLTSYWWEMGKCFGSSLPCFRTMHCWQNEAFTTFPFACILFESQVEDNIWRLLIKCIMLLVV